MPNSNDLMPPPTFPPATRAAWMWRLTGGVLLLATCLTVAFMMASFLHWRTDAQARSAASAQSRYDRSLADQSRYDHARVIQVGSLR